MDSLVYLLETLFVVLLGWIIIQLWTNCITACCTSCGLDPASGIHMGVVALGFTVILVAFIRCSGKVGSIFETQLEGNEISTSASMALT